MMAAAMAPQGSRIAQTKPAMRPTTVSSMPHWAILITSEFFR
jgi:hypothetical protein